MLSDALAIEEGAPARPGDAVAAQIVALDASLAPFVPLYLHLLWLRAAASCFRGSCRASTCMRRCWTR